MLKTHCTRVIPNYNVYWNREDNIIILQDNHSISRTSWTSLLEMLSDGKSFRKYSLLVASNSACDCPYKEQKVTWLWTWKGIGLISSNVFIAAHLAWCIVWLGQWMTTIVPFGFMWLHHGMGMACGGSRR